MIKLKKQKSTEWLGNGFGGDTAEWVVAKDESIGITKIGFNWRAYQEGKCIARGYTRADLLESLEEKRPELAA